MSIKKLSSGRYQIDYRDENNVRRRESYDTHKIANDALKSALAAVSKARRTGMSSGLDAGHRTIRELVDFHVQHVMAGWLPASVKDWLPRVRTFIEWCERQGITDAAQVSKRHALAYATYCSQNYTGHGIQLRLTAASSIFKSELDFAEPPCVTRNPFVTVKKSGYARKRRPKLIERSHLGAFLSCCKEFEYHLFRLLYGGGFRKDELTNLTWAQVKDERIILGDHNDWEAKTEESMGVIRLNAIVSESLAWFKARSGTKKYVLDLDTFIEHWGRRPKIAGKPGPNFISRRFERVRTEAKNRYPDLDWENFTPHKLRGAYGSHLAELGVPLTIIQQCMRHKNYMTTAWWYINVAPSAVDEGAKVLGKVDLSHKHLDTSLDTSKPQIAYSGAY